MSTTEYGDLLERASHLDAKSQMSLLADLAALVRDGGKQKKRHDIMEFEGIAEGLWEGVDVQAYLDGERNSWDG